MSYRDIRNLIETLRVLGYPNLVSMESFRSANFPLVADLLAWLSKRFDPDVEIPLEIDDEQDRVKLIRNVAEFMAVKGNIRLNTKRLYQADGYAIKELLKVTKILHEALLSNLEQGDDENIDDVTLDLRDFDLSDKISELKFSRQLAGEITTSGTSLYDLLGKEIDLKIARHKSIARQFELSEVEAGIKEAIKSINQEILDTKQLIENVAATEASLDTKIEKRNVEIGRYEKRLQALKKVRPAFLEEFTALEKELEELFIQYSLRLRCLNLLEKQFTESEMAQIEKQVNLSLPHIQTIPLEKMDEDDIFLEKADPALERNGASNRHEKQPRATTTTRPHKTTQDKESTKAYGSMQPPLIGSQSSLDFSSDSESDDIFLDKDEPELMQSDESLALELAPAAERRAPSGRLASSKPQDSDDDF
ncbi:clusterin-associated protein 1 [Diabrotica virgifera virgifera]|uniref:Clusterin-associated protein 1 n=1 Tax=Diabrotica virgifera virgifera TaxID=50390 RepID=A0A6P7FVM2_DIAVI|nr:clusterin-associated protein 1 [Diabrotica virgifera virgifera]